MQYIVFETENHYLNSIKMTDKESHEWNNWTRNNEKKWHISSNWIDKRANICKSIMALRNKAKIEKIGWKLIKK